MIKAPSDIHTHKPAPTIECVQRFRAIKASLLKQGTPREEIDTIIRGWVSELFREGQA